MIPEAWLQDQEDGEVVWWPPTRKPVTRGHQRIRHLEPATVEASARPLQTILEPLGEGVSSNLDETTVLAPGRSQSEGGRTCSSPNRRAEEGEVAARL